MKVAVQNEKMKKALAERGFEVTDYENSYADAVVYEGSMNEVLSQSRENNRGVLLVNSTGKSPAEVAHILKRKLYTPLF